MPALDEPRSSSLWWLCDPCQPHGLPAVKACYVICPLFAYLWGKEEPDAAK